MKPSISKRLINAAAATILITFFSLLIDIVPAITKDNSAIWLGEAIEVSGAILVNPLVGCLAALFKCAILDYIIYGNLEYLGTDITQALAVLLIALIYRRICRKKNKFGVKEILTFNFAQIVINIGVCYFLTVPIFTFFFSDVIDSWSRDQMSNALSYLVADTFTACISTALIGTIIIAVATSLKKRMRRSKAIKISSLLPKITYISYIYRSRAIKYFIGAFLAVIVTIVDSILSGHILGQDALAAVSVAFPLVFLTAFLSPLCVNGCIELCSELHGQKEYERANKLFTLGLIATLAIGLLQTALYWGIKDLYFNFFIPGTDTSIRLLAEQYYSVLIFLPPVIGLMMFLGEAAASDGDDRLSTSGYVVAFILNIVFSCIFVRIAGIKGLAIGTLLAYGGCILFELTHFLKKSNTYRLRPYFSWADIKAFITLSFSKRLPALCMFVASIAFTKGITTICGSGHLIANTILCSMLVVYEMVKAPSEGAYDIIAAYFDEKNFKGLKEIFSYSMWVCILIGLAFSMLIFTFPDLVLYLFGIANSPIQSELIQCIRFCAIGITAASFTGFLNNYYCATRKPFWSDLLILLRSLLLPAPFCLTFSVNEGVVGMGRGMLLSQIITIAILFGFMLVAKGLAFIPYMVDVEEFQYVYCQSFEFNDAGLERLSDFVEKILKFNEVPADVISRKKENVRLLFDEIRNLPDNKDDKNLLGECVIAMDDKSILKIKDTGKLFTPGLEALEFEHTVLLENNCNIFNI